MVARNTILTTMLASVLYHIEIAQSSMAIELILEANETSTTSSPPPMTMTSSKCKYPDEFPLFNDETCISRQAYTAIFLISIILAGISFLSFAFLLCCLCRRYWKSEEPYDDSDSELETGNRPPDNLRTIAATTARSNDQTTERRSYQSTSGAYNSGSHDYATSSAPYAVDDPVRTEVKHKRREKNKPPPDSIPLAAREHKNHASTKPKPSQIRTTDLDDYHDEKQMKIDSTSF